MRLLLWAWRLCPAIVRKEHATANKRTAPPVAAFAGADAAGSCIDGGTCPRGCDQSCQSCSQQCNTCEQACTSCSALEPSGELDIPRFWLNTLRWLTPANECQVPVPIDIVF